MRLTGLHLACAHILVDAVFSARVMLADEWHGTRACKEAATGTHSGKAEIWPIAWSAHSPLTTVLPCLSQWFQEIDSEDLILTHCLVQQGVIPQGIEFNRHWEVGGICHKKATHMHTLSKPYSNADHSPGPEPCCPPRQWSPHTCEQRGIMHVVPENSGQLSQHVFPFSS